MAFSSQLSPKMVEINDPLNINLERQAQILLSQLPSSSSLPDQLCQPLEQITKASLPPREALTQVSRLLAVPYLTTLVARAFRPLLVELCARFLEDDLIDEVKRLEALAFLVEIHEEVYPVISAFLARPSLQEGPLGFLLAMDHPTISNIPPTSLHRLLILYYRLLYSSPFLAGYLSWPIHALSSLLYPTPHPDMGVRYLAIRCYALHTRMCESERLKLEDQLLGGFAINDANIEYGEKIREDGDGVESYWVDGWVFPIIEVKRIDDYRRSLLEPVDFYSERTGSSIALTSADLHPRVVNVSGILLFRSTPHLSPPSILVETPSTINATRTLALRLSRGLPTLITSTPGAGKSFIINHLSSRLFQSQNQVVNIHLSDTSLDARSLIGSYISSATKPGTFEWVEGALVRAMKEGKWVVFKDIDKASGEVLGTLVPLVESLGITKEIGRRAQLEIHGRPKVIAAESFALFATRSIPASLNQDELHFPQPAFLGHQHWFEVQIPAPTYSEQLLILSAKFPRLAGRFLLALLNVWDTIQTIIDAGRGKGGIQHSGMAREIGLRDVEKWVNRVNSLNALYISPQDGDVDMDIADASIALVDMFPNTTIREEILLEAFVIFAGYISPNSAHTLSSFIAAVGRKLGLSEERAKWVIEGRTPTLELEKSTSTGRVEVIRIGNSVIHSRKNQDQTGPSMPSRPFALHRPSLLLLEQLSACVQHQEPLLLVGETGTGKTTSISYLAGLAGQKLVALNLSNQTESSDLLGGFRPVDIKVPCGHLQSIFTELFDGTFSLRRNGPFWEEVRKSFAAGKWKRVVNMWKEGISKARKRFGSQEQKDVSNVTGCSGEVELDSPRKRRKVEEGNRDKPTLENWEKFEKDVQAFEVQHLTSQNKFVFDFVQGPLINALKSGHWVLLDEINLATPETLEALTPLLQSTTSSITLTEQGSLMPVPRHPSFRLFASMNPATDVGKKDLPPNLRSRFTEVYVSPPDHDRSALLAIITQYIGHIAVADKAAIMDVAEFYCEIRQLAETGIIADGSNKRPHFSMRTLARALTFAVDVTPSFALRRALWEGCLMSFTMSLDEKSASLVVPLMERWLLRGVSNISALLSQVPSLPSGGGSREDYVQVGPFWLRKGPEPLQEATEYILTPSVQKKLMDLSRIILTRRSPVLVEGPTSAGKTSAIEYLAKRTGHRFVRINNHEHTDIQEYLGTYISDPESGKLVFRDGLLVRALRNGDWVVLDELNLAPTDVLEALNRLLDDNRELFISETQEVVRPHPSFMLFATQNPSGIYAGRKILSRAFRNRFLDVHFGDVPQDELEEILSERAGIARSRAKLIVSVFRELQKRRQTGRIFETKHSFATLRDLFRWAGRDWMEADEVGNRALAEAGYMLLAERARKDDDRLVVKEVIEQLLNVKIDETKLYDLTSHSVDLSKKLGLGCTELSSGGLIWTSALQRTFTLVFKALKHNEPVLLVGETGSGKTSICELFASMMGQKLVTLNCHQNTETADLLGGQRPVRNRSILQTRVYADVRSALLSLDVLSEIEVVDDDSILSLLDRSISDGLHSPDVKKRLNELRRRLKQASALFEWQDGPLVDAMRNGDVFLLDEISLADDSVLERLNSVLEPSRTLILAEKGGWDLDAVQVTATPSFKLVATMNPGGDYGKKELSHALRNRFTEIWVPQLDSRADRLLIIRSMWEHEELVNFGPLMLDFCDWFVQVLGDNSVVGLRDLLAWVTFSNRTFKAGTSLSEEMIFHHAAHMSFIDGIPSIPQAASYSSAAILELQSRCRLKLNELVPLINSEPVPKLSDDRTVHIGSFGIARGPHTPTRVIFNLAAPTTQNNAMRVFRASQVSKPILLEGSPGVGKTSLISALADLTGNRLCRVNLSDQTDLMDLFGSDLPVEGGKPGEFVWKDASFLRALQEGDWVLLDEMNLAPQAVLEGLNAVLDHRGMVYLPELGRSFARHPNFRIFAAQNPLGQGGGRKGLPKSFLNRFTKVYINELSPEDVLLVCQHLYPAQPAENLWKMIEFNAKLHERTMVRNEFGRDGSPWEFNLRDVLRWVSLLENRTGLELSGHPVEHLSSIYLQRFRSTIDRSRVSELFSSTFGCAVQQDIPVVSISPNYIQFGHCLQPRLVAPLTGRPTQVLHVHHDALQTIGSCLAQGWLVIIYGQHSSGKTTLVHQVADLSGVALHTVSINHAMDTMDLLGSFEQVDLDVKLRLLCDGFQSRLGQLTSTMDGLHLSTIRSRLRWPVHASPSEIAIHLGTWMEECGLTSDLILKRIIDAILGLPTDLQGSSRFEWVDGPLVKAVKEGQWLLLDNANLCNPSVLDRLNSLCETNGTLALTERGLVNGEVQILTPHPEFRLFMAVDPKNGELSRAMRNRGVEVTLVGVDNMHDFQLISDVARLPKNLDKSLAGSEFQYHLYRRGLAMSASEFLPSTPHFRGVNHDSASTATLRLFNLRGLSDTTVSVVHQSAWVETLLRAATPSSLNQLRRTAGYLLHDHYATLAFISLVDKTFKYPIIGVSSSMKDEIKTSQGVTPAFLSWQPIDILLNPNLNVRYDGKLSPSSTIILDIVDLSLRLQRLESATISSTSQPLTILEKSRNVLNSTKELQRGVAEIYPLIAETQRAMSSILMEFGSSQPSTIYSTLQTMLKVIAYTSHLQVVASSRHFDYSSALAVLSWFDGLEWNDYRLSEVKVKAENLAMALRSTTGRAMHALWSHHLRLSDSIHPDNAEKIRQLSRLASFDQEDRSKVLDLMGILSLSQTRTSAHQIDIENLLRDIEGRSEEMQLSPSLTDSHYICIQEFRQLSCTSLDAQEEIQGTSQLIDEALRCPNYPIIRLMPLRRFCWKVEDTRSWSTRANLKTSLTSNWMDSLWTLLVGTKDGALLGGPAALLQPQLLIQTIDGLNSKAKTLREFDEYRASTFRLARLATTDAHGRVLSVSQRLLTIFVDQLCALCSAFETTYEANIFWQIIDMLHRWNADIKSNRQQMPPNLFTLISSTSDHFVGQAISRYLHPCMEQLQQSASSVLDVTSCYLSLARFILHLYIPDIPIDPAVVQRSTFEFLQSEVDSLDARIAVNQQAASTVPGTCTNLTVKVLTERRDEVLQKLQCVAVPDICRQSDVERLHSLFAEITQFCQHVISEEKLEQMSYGLITGAEAGRYLEREAMIQGSITGFLQRVHTMYEDLIDVVRPFEDAVQLIRFSLRLNAQLSLQRRSEAAVTTSSLKAMLSFPPILSALHLRNIEGPKLMQATKEHVPLAQWLVLGLWGLVQEVRSGGFNKERLLGIEETYEKLCHLWINDRDKKAKEEVDSHSLYRRHNEREDILSDSEVEEREFRELFPQYEDYQQSTNTSASGRPSASQVNDSFVHDVFLAHQEMFFPSGASSGATLPVLAKDAVRSLVSIPPGFEGIDESSVAYRIWLINDHAKKFEGYSGSPRSSRPDFYRDPNTMEARKAMALIKTLLGRVDDLISEWPDQMILHHIRDRCEVVLDFSVDSPVAKLVAGMEQLVVQMDDWESYANRDNSLRSQQHEVANLIVEWRRLELGCWAELLESQAVLFAAHVYQWWFRLYEVIVYGTINAAEAAEDPGVSVDQHLANMSPLLDQYVTSSPLGEFDQRLRLLASFCNLLDHLQEWKTGNTRVALKRAARLVESTNEFYSQLRQNAISKLAKDKGIIENEIRGFIKLASWKDINVQSLKASAQRTHHQLYKSVRKFREILRQPVDTTSVFQAENGDLGAVVSESSLTAARRLIPIRHQSHHLSGSVPHGQHMLSLQTALVRLDDLINKDIQSFLLQPLACRLEEFSADILSTVHALGATKIDMKDDPETRSKSIKALTVRKRRAWADLLKELKAIGVSQNVKPDILSRQQSRPWLLEQVGPSPHGIDNAAGHFVVKANDYHHRLLNSIPHLRRSLVNHHSDISTRDLQRGISFIESLLNVALSSRSCMAPMLQNFRIFSRAIDRLRMLSTHRLAYSGSALPHDLADIQPALCQLRTALEEIQAGLIDYSLCCEAGGNGSKLSIETQTTISDLLRDVRQYEVDVRGILDTIFIGEVVILIEEELSTLNAAKTLISRVENALVALSQQPVVYHYCKCLIDWLQKSRTSQTTNQEGSRITGMALSEEMVINAILITAQNLVKITQPDSSISENRDDYFIHNHNLLRRMSSALDLELIVKTLLEFTAKAVDRWAMSPEAHMYDICRILPFIERHLLLVQAHIIEYAKWTKAVYKLTHVLCSTVQTLAEKGFCKPSEETNLGADNESAAELAEGTGLGEGSGNENVSNQIEDESQVEGLQGEETDTKGKEDEGGEDDAIEMGDDFAGDLEDVEEDAKNADGESNEGSDEEHDEQMGNLDPLDPNAVDEKLWGSDKGPDDQETLENEQKSGGVNDDSEVAAKEGGKQDEDKDNTKERKDGQEDITENEKEEEDGGPDLETCEPELGAKLDEHLPETDALDLPDDMELDAENKGNDNEMDVDDDEFGDSLDEDKEGNPSQEQNADPESGSDKGGDEKEEDEIAVDVQDRGEDPEENKGPTEDDVTLERQDMDRKGQGGDSGPRDEGTQGKALEEGPSVKDDSTDIEPEGEKGNAEDLGERLIGQPEPPRPSETEGTQGPTAGTGNAAESVPQTQPERHPIPNPVRHLGDALKEIRRRFEEINEATRDQNNDMRPLPQSEESHLEYLQDDKKVEEELQALGPSGPEEANTRLRDLKISEEEEVAPQQPEDVNDSEMEVEESFGTAEQLHNFSPPTMPDSKDGNLEHALADTQTHLPTDGVVDIASEPDDHNVKSSLEREDPVDEELVESELRRWLDPVERGTTSTAESLWRLYETLTHDLSFVLCEQLRLILSPTLATRLKGDYRTGKRLNMKKIIPYIASDFTKDKIWLRRTKPSQREYQVLIALDDSKSMAESHSVHLAYQTLTLVSKALSRLEVGEVGVMKFGKTVEVLKGFGDATSQSNLSDSDGARVLGSFNFSQVATNVLELLQTSLGVLAEAREKRSGTASGSQRATLWQLEIIISDGICQDHEKMRAALRKAEEQKVMIVFVILDSLHRQHAALQLSSGSSFTPASSSILSMNQVEYKKNPATGKMEMNMGRYLDTFPFQYYIVLRDVESLPDVLSRTLREFFEKTVEE